jgi:hypothetical protein
MLIAGNVGSVPVIEIVLYNRVKNVAKSTIRIAGIFRMTGLKAESDGRMNSSS